MSSSSSDPDARSDNEEPTNVASPSPAASLVSDNDESNSNVGSEENSIFDVHHTSEGDGVPDSDAEEQNRMETDEGERDRNREEHDIKDCDDKESEDEGERSEEASFHSEAGKGDVSGDEQEEDGRESQQSDAPEHSKEDNAHAEVEDKKEVTESEEELGSAKGDSDDEGGPSSPKKDSDTEGEADDKQDGERSDGDDSDNESDVGDLIANIFGESDDESEFEGFGPEDLVSPKKKEKKSKKTVVSDSEDEVEAGGEEKPADAVSVHEEEKKAEEEEEEQKAEAQEEETVPSSSATASTKPSAPVSSSDDELDDGERRSRSDFISDFDLMMAKKKEENSRRRRRKDVDIISDTDDIIADIIKEMKTAAEEDKELNKNKHAATKKLKFLPVVASQLKKMDLKVAFLDQGVLHVMAEWLSPLPDKSLPHLTIREFMLKLLAEFPPLDQGILKSSGIGRAVMYLYKHPKETKENREKAGKLINEWARPIFNLNTNYSSISKEEREQKDFERMPQKRKLRLESSEEPQSKKDIDRALTGEDKSLRPGEKGWIARARVPMPSTKDYVVRPKWNCDTEFVKNTKKTVTRLDRHMRQFQERKKKMKSQRAVTISIEGRHMSL